MAKILYSALVAGMRGRLNGSVAAQNRSGSYLRNLTVPLNPRSEAQQSWRARIGTWSSMWRTLSDDARAAWTAMAVNYPQTNAFGNTVVLSGQQLFVKITANRALVLLAPLVIPVAPESMVEITVTDFEVDGSLDTMTFTPTVANASAYGLVLEATPPLSAGISNANNKFKFLNGFATITSGTAVTFETLYNAVFGAVPPTDSKVFIRLSLVHKTTGQRGIPFVFSTISQ